jgi:hypothetical protein
MGVAIGFFCAFVVPVGQMVLAWFLAYLVRAAKIPAVACTWVTNPYTFPVFIPLQCYCGSIVLGAPLKFQRIKEVLDGVIKEPTLASFFLVGKEFLVSLFVGGFIFGIVSGVISYFVAYGVILRYRQQRKKKLNIKLAEAAKRTS